MLNRISILKDKMLSQPRFVSIEQALIITRTYQENEDKSIPYKRGLWEIEQKVFVMVLYFQKVEFLGWIVNLKRFQHVLKISLMFVLKTLRLFVK